MQTIRIQTAQNVDIEYELAGIGDRIVAYLVDGLIYAAYYLLVLLVAGQFKSFSGTWSIFLAMLPILFYQLICEVFMNGQSIGKRVRQIRVVSLDGKQPHLGQYLVRWLFRILDTMASSGVIAVLTISLSKKGQRLGDLLAGTTVVRMKNRTGIDDTIFLDTDEGYIVRYPQVTNLTDQDVSLLKEVLNRFEKSPANANVLLEKASSRIRQMLRVDPKSAPELFLRDVIRDYNFLTSRERG